MTIMIYVQHLLGVGHLQRMLLLAAGLAADFDVTLVSGGRPTGLATAGVRVVQLPPLRSIDGRFAELVDADDRPIDARWKAGRREALLAAYREAAPRLLLTETFPFGRRMLRFELLPLLEAARADPNCRVIAASIRDILQPKSRPDRIREICELVECFYDYVLVHGDARLTPLSASFEAAAEFADKIVYSGYICRPAKAFAAAAAASDEVIVSAGGSNTGLELLRCALAARSLGTLADSPWRLLVSPSIDEDDFADLARRAGADVRVERNRPDFPALLRQARLSISQAGYNTVTDMLEAGVPAVLVPYAEFGEVEQTLRARLLAERGRAIELAPAALTPASLAAAAARALELKPRLDVDLDGIAHSAEHLRRWLERAAVTPC